MNRPQCNHNPGNLMYAGQRGSTGKDEKGFAMFPDDLTGWLALVRQIDLDQTRGDTIEKFVSEYAPAHENDTPRYIQFICDGLRAQPSDKLNFYSKYAIAGLIAVWEGYFVR